MPANTEDARDKGSIPGLVRSPGEQMTAYSNTRAWKISCTEEPGGLQSMELTKSWTWLNMHTHRHTHTHMDFKDLDALWV